MRAELIEALSQKIHTTRLSHPLRVAIDGVDAAGKTTLADQLGRRLVQLGRSVIRASIDGFHNRAAVRRQRSDLAEGYYRDSFNYPALIHELLSPLGPGGSLRYRRAVFDHRSDCPVDEPDETAQSDSILLFDGVFLLRGELRQLWDFTILVEADFDVTLARAEARDQYLFGEPAAVRNRYETRYIPGQRKYLDRERPELVASVIVRNNDPENPILMERIPIQEKGVANVRGEKDWADYPDVRAP